ncbi:MAG TPA: thioredoxin family protein [Sunxiuqinia sp.]|nr:thioredoxin family protein [Sunxiuqinia sp.]
MNIKVLGTGCAKCKSAEKTAQEAVREMGIDADVEKVEDIYKIMQYGVMRTPAIVIDEKVVLSGKVPSVKEFINLITQIQPS